MTDYEALVERLRERRRMTRKRYGLTGETLAEERDLDEAADAIRDLRATVQTLSRYRESLSEVIAERDRWKNEALLMAAHQGIDNYQRIMDERDALRERLRYACELIDDVQRYPGDGRVQDRADAFIAAQEKP
jgi:two-component sensor histidine kinase